MTDMTDLYIVNTETLYPSKTDFDSVVVRLYGRTRDQTLKQVTVRGFDPYFYTTPEEADKVNPADHEDLVGYEETEYLPLRDRFAHRDPWREPRDLVKVIAEHPGAVRGLRKNYDTTWGADCIFTERFRIDTEIRTGVRVPDEAEAREDHFIVDDTEDLEPVEMTDVEPRVVTLDIETDDRDTGFPEPGEARVLSIVAYDSYEQEYTAWVDLNGRSFEDHFDLDPVQRAKLENDDLSLADMGLDHIDALEFEPSERRMLINFASWVAERNPDLICGWNSGDESTDGFDLPMLIERMRRENVNPSRLAREAKVKVYNGQVELQGRNCYDLMDGWDDTKFTNPRSLALEYAARQEVEGSDGKIKHEDVGFYEMYREQPVKFLNYNGLDTQLTVEVNEGANVLGFKKRLKDMIGVDWARTHENNEFIEMSVRRKCREHGLVMITKYDNPYTAYGENTDDGVNYEGAYVFPSFNGVKHNVCGIDLASLYPMTQWMLNASPDTRIDRKKAWKHDIDHVVAANGQTFRNDVDGIIRELVDEYHEVKAEFKAERNAAEYGTEAWEEAAEAYNVTKTIYNSYYGYSGWDKSPLYNPEDAAAITLTGQEVIKATAEYVNAETAGEVVYGDTDSTYVEFPTEWDQVETLEYVEDICTHLNDELYPALAESDFNIPAAMNRWEIEPEMRAERFFMSDSKKNYAYLKKWDEGDPYDEVVGEDKTVEDLDFPFSSPEELDADIPDTEGKFDVTGYQCVKSNFALMTKEVQETILELIVRDADETAVSDVLFEAACDIDAADPDWDYLRIPQGLGKEIDKEKAHTDDAYSWSTTGDHPRGEAPRAAFFSNQLPQLDLKFSEGDKPMRAKVKPGLTANGEEVDIIAYEDAHDLAPLADEVKMDVAEMQRKVLKNPMEDIFAALGVEIESALQGKCQTQAGLGAFM